MELDATAADLRTIGCRPGAYRLDAVDQARRTLGVTAYTEVAAGELEDRGDGAGVGAEAAVAALARAVEAMQRVQAERERAQAAMFQKLIDRIAPPPVARPAEEMRNAVMHALDLRKEMRKAMDEEREDYEEDEEEDADGGESDASATLAAQIVALVQQFPPLIAARLADPRPVAHGGAGANPPPAAATNGAEARAAGRAARERPDTAGGDGRAEGDDRGQVDAAIATVLGRLSAAEQRKAVSVLKRLPASAIREIERRLVALPVDQAANEARRMLLTLPDAPAEPGDSEQSGGPEQAP